jgi:hypothetical protein
MESTWSSKANRNLQSELPFNFGMANGMTRFLGVRGVDAMLANTTGVRPADIIDGADNTILLVEDSNSKVHWLEPADLEIAEVIRLLGNWRMRPAVLFADFEIYRVCGAMNEDTIRGLCTYRGKEPISRAQLVKTGILVSIHDL